MFVAHYFKLTLTEGTGMNSLISSIYINTKTVPLRPSMTKHLRPCSCWKHSCMLALL